MEKIQIIMGKTLVLGCQAKLQTPKFAYMEYYVYFLKLYHEADMWETC